SSLTLWIRGKARCRPECSRGMNRKNGNWLNGWPSSTHPKRKNLNSEGDSPEKLAPVWAGFFIHLDRRESIAKQMVVVGMVCPAVGSALFSVCAFDGQFSRIDLRVLLVQ